MFIKLHRSFKRFQTPIHFRYQGYLFLARKRYRLILHKYVDNGNAMRNELFLHPRNSDLFIIEYLK